jgi:AGZA family xanthine/uracil permease-like MFS transporter
MKMIPKAVKVSTIVGMGLQIALLGMMSINLVVKNESTLVSIGPLNDLHIWMALGGLLLTASLIYHHVKGAILIGIVTISLVVWATDRSFPSAIAQLPRIQVMYMCWMR